MNPGGERNACLTGEFVWAYRGRTFAVGYDQRGQGRPVLLLPALSTISTRDEWKAVAEALADEFTITTVDWPGFGARPHPRAHYDQDLLLAFLVAFVRSRFADPVAVAAAGHAAGFALRAAARGLLAWSRLSLVAPTWRGPLPSAMGEHPRTYALLRVLVAAPGLGHMLYRLNAGDWFLRWMTTRHVYADPTRITPAMLAEKQAVARQRGARFAAAAFVTGALDPFPDRGSCLAALRGLRAPVQLFRGDHTPPRSRQEMLALGDAVARGPVTLPGALALHEESAPALIGPLRSFLCESA